MSRWTHVAGVIRVDSALAPLGAGDKPWLSRAESWLAQAPAGSEGPICGSTYLRSGGLDSSLSRGGIFLHGDLRDFGTREDLDSIINWLVRLNLGEGSFIRQGVVQVLDEAEENSGTVCLYSEEWEWIPIIGRRNW